MSEKTEQPEQPKQPDFLTFELASEMGGAFHRLDEIRKSEPSAELENEAAGLVEYLSGNFLKHGTELLGCFFVAKGEYQPLVQALAPVFRRHTTQMAIEQMQARAATVKDKGNIIQVPAGAFPTRVK